MRGGWTRRGGRERGCRGKEKRRRREGEECGGDEGGGGKCCFPPILHHIYHVTVSRDSVVVNLYPNL